MDLRNKLLLRYRDRLELLALRSNCKHQHGALLLDKHLEPIVGGYNYSIQSINPARYDVIHAEVSAIHKWLKAFAPRGREAWMILVARLNARGDFVLSKPCPACMKFINDQGLTPVWS